MWRDTPITSYEDPEIAVSHVPLDSPQRMLIMAYTRLFLLPERPDGSKLTTIASYGAYDIRLTKVLAAKAIPELTLWIELYDRVAGRVIDGAGCRDLDEAGTAVEALIAEALWRAGIVSSNRPQG